MYSIYRTSKKKFLRANQIFYLQHFRVKIPHYMNTQQFGVSPHKVNLPRQTLKKMIAVVHDLQNLCETPAYQNSLPNLAKTAQIEIHHHSVLMGYDFHITDTHDVKLIEANTNAGGLWFASGINNASQKHLPNKLASKLIATFINEYQLFTQDAQAKPKLVAIIDQHPSEQFLYPEMRAFIQMFAQVGIGCIILDPSEIEFKNNIPTYNQQRIDLIYNRHCDFYFNSVEMQAIAKAWQAQSVCITPNPRVYGLLADKQRMVDWSQTELLNNLLPAKSAIRLRQAIPSTQMLSSLDQDTLWPQRKSLVFKPTNSYASRGVYIGKKLTKGKLASLDPQTTLVQEHIKPSITMTTDNTRFKTDFRLFVYRSTVLAICARIYQGQVTNLRTPNGGFSQLTLTNTL